jgi:4'-phosphopantetheinyl transferase
MADDIGKPPTVLVRWLRTSDRGWAHRQVLAGVVELTGRPSAGLRLSHLCARCGSDGHGRPVVMDGRRPLPMDVSLSRSDEISVVALSSTARVGIDVERVAATSFDGFDETALHRDERAAGDRERAVVWSRKESLLKALGTGLTVDPRTVQVSAPAGAAYVVACPGLDDADRAPWLTDLDLGDGYAACLTVLAAARPGISVEPAGREARSP